jgi:hypothetical protein
MVSCYLGISKATEDQCQIQSDCSGAYHSGWAVLDDVAVGSNSSHHSAAETYNHLPSKLSQPGGRSVQSNGDAEDLSKRAGVV